MKIMSLFALLGFLQISFTFSQKDLKHPVDGKNIFNQEIEQYVKKLEKLKVEYNIPSISTAILYNQKVIFSKGFGFSDIENKITTTDTTPYQIASVTKPIASTIILKLVQEGKIDINKNIIDYWKDYREYFDNIKKYIEKNAPQFIGVINNFHYERDDIMIKHLLTHTSEGIPGERFSYSGFLYSELARLVDNVSKRNFYTLVKEDIILKLNMNNSLPQQVNADTWRSEVHKRIAKPYHKNEKNELVLGDFPEIRIGAGGGIVSTVKDLAKFDIALDNDKLISPEMKKLAFTPAKLNNGNDIPYGLGWFIGSYKNLKVVYHTGWQPAAYSALYLKVPDKNLTLILLSNSDDLIASFMDRPGAGEIAGSPFAKEFLDLFVKMP